uniref:Uncharacterized protein n=1 Tax=Glossina pallidipes TaxID=7398 RepID=A0A1A9Z2S4_GLOPL
MQPIPEVYISLRFFGMLRNSEWHTLLFSITTSMEDLKSLLSPYDRQMLISQLDSTLLQIWCTIESDWAQYNSNWMAISYLDDSFWQFINSFLVKCDWLRLQEIVHSPADLLFRIEGFSIQNALYGTDNVVACVGKVRGVS